MSGRACRPRARPVACGPGHGDARPTMPNRIQEVFGAPRVLLPVIHPVDERAARASVRVAVEAGCRGVFLINQGMSADQVLALMMTVRRDHPRLWIGVNLLGHPPAEVLARGLAAGEGRLDGIWTDHAGVEPDGRADQAAAFATARGGWRGLYLGGVAFKYQAPVPAERLGEVARIASAYLDVVCTSGPGTGHAADPAKVIAMREGLGPEPALALASGVTDENVAGYLPYVDAYLVGTGIEHELGVLDPARVTRLQAPIAAWR